MTSSSDDNKVGYGHPPKGSRFKPGQSGNPGGRRKGQPNLKTDLAEELGEVIRIREGDKERPVSKQRALIKALMAKALKGDARCASLLLGLVATHIEANQVPETEAGPELSVTDEALIADFLRRNSAAPSKGGHDE